MYYGDNLVIYFMITLLLLDEVHVGLNASYMRILLS